MSPMSLLKHSIATTAGLLISAAASAQVFISEIHYDNAGADTGEAIEISGDPATDLSGWRMVFYNGSETQRSPYGEIDLSDASLAVVDGCGGTGLYYQYFAGIQNGSPDGVALIDNTGAVIQFISYEGSFTAASGPAEGLSSIDIGVAEASDTPAGYSLQFVDGAWLPAAEDTFGSCISEDEPDAPGGITKIHAIQGDGGSVSATTVFTVEAIVTGDFQGSEQLDGFFIQEEDADVDNNSATSEGIFFYCATCPVDVAVGDKVRVTGLAGEFGGTSQLSARNAADIQILASNEPLPTPVVVNLPIAVTASDLNGATNEINQFYEAFEGMLVTVAGDLSVTEYFELSRYGQIVLSADGRLRQFTDKAFPSEAGLIAHQIENASRTIILDDDSSSQNHALFNNVPLYHPQPGFSATNYFRGGDTITDLTGPLHFAFSEWRIRPVSEAFSYQFNRQNPRSTAPENVGGSFTVASFNVLNYFTTIDNGTPACGPDANMDCRGADSDDELLRQTAKIVSALCAMNADIVGLMELENPRLDALQTPIGALVDAVNEQCGPYRAIETGTVGTDAITVGVIYKPESVEVVGNTAVLDSGEFVDPNQSGEGKNRPAIAQSFRELASGEVITVAVNHLKSKGSACGAGDDDTTTGQGNCNDTRTKAAQVQANWLASHPTGVETENTLIIGDLNAYRNEDPIMALEATGYTDLVDFFSGADAYGYVFDGQLGYLDHALASDNMLPYISGVAHWHINADEVNVLDYNNTVLDSGEQSFEAKPSSLPLFADDAYRSSDHDPVIIGVAFPQVPSCNGRTATIYVDADGMVIGGEYDGQPYQGLLVGSRGNNVIVGTSDSDIIFSRKGSDVICAGAGDDLVIATKGENIIYGEAGNDLIQGGKHSDEIYGGEGDDYLSGGNANDFIDGGSGDNLAIGGRGRDTCANSVISFCEVNL